MAKKYEAGQTIGNVTILKEFFNEKNKKYLLRCNRCGKEFIGYSSYIKYMKNGCAECNRELNRIRLVDPEIGKTYNNLKILGYDKEASEKSTTNARYVKCLCLKCQNETSVKLTSVKNGVIKECVECAKKNLDIGHDYIKQTVVDGTSVLGLMRKKTNKNSTTGHTGVSQFANGTYRAYINFKRKQYNLGCYTNLDDAVKVRKKAEERIYGNFLKWYAETYPEMWEKLNKDKTKGDKNGE